MWSGVIVITRTMTTWTVTRATIATGTFGRRRTAASEVGIDRSPVTGRRSESSSARAYGSGRSMANDRIAAAPTNTTGTRYAPARCGSPRVIASVAAGAARFGPMIAPIVAPQTTSPRADARRATG